MSKLLAIRSLLRSSWLRPSVQRRFNRCFNNFGDPRKYEKFQEAFRKKDDIPSEFVLIYRNKIEPQIFGCTVLSISAMLIGTATLIDLCFFEQTPVEELTEYDDDLRQLFQPESTQSKIFSSLLFYAVFVILMYYLRRFPLRLYNYKNQYIAVTHGYMPFTRSKLSFDLSDVVPPEEYVRRFINFSERTYDFDGQKAMLVDEYFRTPSDVAKLASRKL